MSPTNAPTDFPTVVPTRSPTNLPTDVPTRNPTEAPTAAPTDITTEIPTMSPTNAPTGVPTRTPTGIPTEDPTFTPTASPTEIQTEAPTVTPTDVPTEIATEAPTFARTDVPTGIPTQIVTSSDLDLSTEAPTVTPTDVPTRIPTAIPTEDPTFTPTASPTEIPTEASTVNPTDPTEAPTVAPTGVPTEFPTEAPTLPPTGFSTEIPTEILTVTPTALPTEIPTEAPSVNPTDVPTEIPTVAPAANATASPTFYEPDPPLLSHARFSNTGGSITIGFDSNTNQGSSAGLSTIFECDALFEYEGYASSCTWSSSSAVVMTLGATSDIMPGDNITLLEDSLQAMCIYDDTSICESWDFSSRHSVSVSSPSESVQPTIQLFYSEEVASCEDISIDGSGSYGSGGRSMLFVWRLHSPAKDEATDLYYFIGNATDSMLKVPNALLSAGTNYEIHVNVSNFLGGSSFISATMRVAENSVPSLIFPGGTQVTAYRSETLSLFGKASVASCNDTETIENILSYSWNSSDQSLVSTSSDPRYFKLGAYSLEVSVDYEFRLTVTDSFGLQTSGSVFVSTSTGSLVAGIVGGSRTVSIFDDLELDASSSYDEDEEDGTPTDVKYYWYCLNSSDVSCGFTLDENVTIKIDNDDLKSGAVYTFMVVVTDGVRRSNTSVDITIVGSAIPILSIQTLLPSKINPTDKLVLAASISSSEGNDVESEWYIDLDSEMSSFNSGALEDATATSLTKTITFTSSTESTTVYHNLVVSADELVSGSVYTFAISAKYSGQSTSAFSQVTAIVNSAPSSGSLVVSPDKGKAMTDTFELRGLNWVDDAEDLPLEYSFVYYDAEETSTILSVQGSSNVISDILLPQGSGSSYSLTCGLKVHDKYGAYGTDSYAVIVRPYSGTAAELAKFSRMAMADAIASYDSGALNNAVVSSASVLDSTNCSLAPNCTALHREPCGDNGDHACGVCLENYIGSAYLPGQQCTLPTSSCSNGYWDSSNETDLDCGGSCQPCVTGKLCSQNADCRYNLCSNGICSVASKSCKNSCNGHGICMYISVHGEQLASEELDIWNDDPRQHIPKPMLSPRQKQLLGMFLIGGYSIFTAYYVCLFGIRFGSSYTNAWLKTFFLGFLQSLMVTRPVKIAVIFLLCMKVVPTKFDIDQVKRLPKYSAVAQTARKYPNLTISKVVLEEDYYPPGYLEAKEEELEREKHRIKCNAEKAGLALAIALAAVLLLLPDDIQDMILEGGVAVAFNYILLACGANSINSDAILYLTVFGVIPLISFILYLSYKAYRKFKQSEVFQTMTDNVEM